MLENFFDVKEDKIEDCNCLPLYTTLEFPEELNLLWPAVRDMSEEEFERYAEKLRIFFLEKYEKDRYPIGAGSASLDDIITRLKKFHNLNINHPDVFFEEDGQKFLKGYNAWSTVIDHWFPEMMDVPITRGINQLTPSIIDLFRDKNVYMKKMKRMLWKDKLNGWRDNPYKQVWPTLKQSIRMGSGTQPVSNIRCPVAKWIYQTYMLKLLPEVEGDEVVVFDPSMGWGGRLISFLSASSKIRNKKCIYIGTDPNSVIYERYGMVERFWKKFIDPSCTAEVHPLCMGSEEFDKSDLFKKYKGKAVLAYTSPPYFNRERYSTDEQQSYKKFSSYDSWKNGFLKKTMENVRDFLMPNGIFVWNIANIKLSKGKYLKMEDDSVAIAKQVGMKEYDKIHMLMRFTIGRDNNLEGIAERASMNVIKCEGKLNKYEPVFVFRKEKG
ncbi:MAG TPA: DNA methyltransferase [Bacteroidales bacterium]|nr:DNA methyltransferase [Bacteroidales bacterium]